MSINKNEFNVMFALVLMGLICTIVSLFFIRLAIDKGFKDGCKYSNKCWVEYLDSQNIDYKKLKPNSKEYL